MKQKIDDPGLALRIKKLVEIAHNQARLAKASGLASPTIKRFLAGTADPGRTSLVALAKATGVTIEWLATGEGSMYEKGRVEVEPSPAVHRDDYTYIPLYDLKAAAGTGEVVYQEDVRDFLCFKTQWIKTNLRGAPKDLFLLHVKGDSMEPTLRSGDIVLIDKSITNPQEEGIYLVRLDSAIMVKRVQILEGKRIEMTSDNERYKPIVVDIRGQADLAVVGRVVWYGRKIV